jgi:hypothetical protein
MENSPWNNINVSLEKDSLSPCELDANIDTQEIRSVVKNNEVEARGLLLSFSGLDKDICIVF